jgi:hypothetical protein
MHIKDESSQKFNLSRMINHPRIHELTRVFDLPTQTVAQKEIAPTSQATITEINGTALA